MNNIHDEFRRHGLVRPQEGRMLGGVMAGIGRRIGLEPWPARLVITALLLVIPGSQILLYPVMWVLMPSEITDAAPVEFNFDDPATAYKPAQNI
jgi:phage shock protein PspC (stress-responsive transcriptional regulator)